MSSVVSLFASSFTLFWPHFFNVQELKYPPSFNAGVVLYPSEDNLKDYLSWRQADCHINNLYSTCFWKLVQERGFSPVQAGERLKGTMATDKYELLFKELNINYNTLSELYRKGTVIIRPKDTETKDSADAISNSYRTNKSAYTKEDKKLESIVLHTDIVSKTFWDEHPHILKAIV